MSKKKQIKRMREKGKGRVLGRKWGEDFMKSNKDCDVNVYFIGTEFSRYLHQDKSFEWVTWDLFSEVVMEYNRKKSASSQN